MASTPVAIVCIGMAGSGKTTFMQRINSHLHAQRDPPYVMNFDPAVKNVPFESNIDIRDSIDYKEVMSQYNLGPNGGILTSLNLFATKVDQILSILEKRCGIPSSSPSTDTDTHQQHQHQQQQQQQQEAASSSASKPITNILIDTPGQIEVFVWSASGQILLSSIASSFPTVIAYIIDTPRTASTSTFMSNMLYACSILYKTKLPMILVFNKTDVQPAEFAKSWMTDFEAFQEALQREEETGAFGGLEGSAAAASGPAVGGSGYMSSLLNSMSLVFEEFYKHLEVVGVSSVTGAGVPEFFEAVKEKRAEFERDYKPELERRRAEREKAKAGKKEKDLDRLMQDMNVGISSASRRQAAGKRKEEPETISDMEDSDEDDDQPPAEFVEPDEGDEEDVDMDEDGGLEKRYQQALADEGGDGSNAEDLSFARYIRSSNINR